ncbi:hypothetical protein ES703_64136 [subsurface metagenome]
MDRLLVYILKQFLLLNIFLGKQWIEHVLRGSNVKRE